MGNMTERGKVYLVGAGPGDPGLLTLKGERCLQQADLVLYDGLVNPLILRHSAAHAERTCRSPSPEGRDLKQDEINRRMIDAALAGKTVVRLKGGDPFIFGRGSEEAAALEEAGIEFEVVPGVTAAVAAGEYAGISLTHRDFASSVAFITGHENPAKKEASLDYKTLAAFPGTLVFYMGLHRLPEISAALIASGKPANTPACVVSRATLPAQQIVSRPLDELPDAVVRAGIRAPSVIIVGECVRLREQAAWFEKLPLVGQRIGITRAIEQADDAISQAIELGAEPVLLPTIHISAPTNWSDVDAELAKLSHYDWLVFTSANGVRSLLGRLWDTGGDARQLGHIRIAAIGPATAEALARFHLRADLVPPSYRAESLAEVLEPQVCGQQVLWARASRGRDVLPDALRAAGATVRELVVYRNEDVESFPADQLSRIERGELDWIVLSSPSIARNLKRLLSPAAEARLGSPTLLASISPVTTQAAEELGLSVSAEATDYTWPGIIDAIISFRRQLKTIAPTH